MSDKEDRSLESQFDAWINVPENIDLLERLVIKNIEQMLSPEMKSELAVGISVLKKHKQHRQELEAIAKDVLNELIATVLQNKKLQQKILGGDRNRFNYIKTAFINELKEKSRDRPWMNLYRNANRVLLKSSRFMIYKPTKGKPLAFSLATDKAVHASPLEQNDFFRIPFPRFDSIDFEAINTKKQLIPLAEYFLEQTAALSNRPCVKVYLKDFISWIACHVVIFDPIKKKSGDAPLKTKKNREAESEHTPESLISIAPSNNENQEEIVNWQQQQQLVPVLAEKFANILDETSRRLFYYRHCAGLTHQELADRMGSKSNLTYQLNKVLGQMKNFLRPLPWLSPESDEGLDEEALQLFIEKLCGKLKELVPEP